MVTSIYRPVLIPVACRRRAVRTAWIAVSLLLSIIVFSGSGALRAAPTEGGDNNLYENALTRFNEEDFEGSIIQLKNVLQQNPADLAARILIGKAYLRLGNAVSAEKELRRALVEGGDEELLIVPLASATYLLERYDEVIEKFVPERRSMEVEAGLRIVRGQAYLARLDLEEAEESFEKAAALRPDESMPMVGLAEVYLARSEVHAALNMANRAVVAAPGNFLAWAVDARAKRRIGREADALISYDKAIELQPEYVEARASRAMILLKMGRFEESAADLAMVQESDPENPFGPYLEALLKLRQKDTAGFLDGLHKTDTLLRGLDRKHLLGDPDKLLLAAVVNLALKNYNDAFNYSREYVGRDRYHPGARKILGELLLRQGKVLEAIAQLEMAAKLAPDDVGIMRQLGLAYLQHGRYEDANITLKSAAALQPEETTLQMMLAGSQLQSGNRDEAVAGLEAAIAKDPAALRPGVMLAMIRMRDRDFDGVIQVSRQLVEHHATNPVLYNFIGTALYAKGEDAEARENLLRAVALNPEYLAAHRNLVQIDLREGDKAAAKARLESMMKMPGAGVQPLTELAALATGEGNLREAVSLLSKAREQEPDNLAVQIELIQMLGRSGDGDAALRNARKLRDRFPENPDVMEQLGLAESAFGKSEDAAVAYRRMASLIRDDADGLLKAARYQVAAGDLTGAYETLNRALVTNGDHLGALEAIVSVESRLKRFDDALARAALLTSRFPDNPLGDKLRGDVHVRQQRYGDAALAYRDALAIQVSGDLLIRQYLARRKSGIEAPTLAPLEAWVAKNPKDYPARAALAAGYLSAKNIPAARALYEELNREEPNDPMVLNNLAEIYLEAGDKRALALAEAAYNLAPRQPETLDTLGWIHVRQGEAAKGLELLRAAYSRASRRPSIRYHLAVALSQLGRNDEARSHLNDILKMNELGDLEAEAKRLLEQIGG
ncbi:MAG: XrtA/PEP-CTERM system TPR-repeat protein PrsT [Alphaproteobacteria bacterium]